MEVHHHSHTSSPPAGRAGKKWTHYFWEFLMLFFAVTLGFFVENQREHFVEAHRAKEFSKSLVEDLQSDITAIQVQKKSAATYISLSDSILDLHHMQLEGHTAANFSFNTRFMYWTVPISWNRATFEQIKNSGSLRYFKNSQLLKKLMSYDVLVNEINSEFKDHQTRGNILLTLINEIIEPTDHHELSKVFIWQLDTLSKASKEIIFPSKIETLENKRGKIKEMLNMIVVQQRNLRRNINDAWQRAEVLAAELIKDLKKEYSFK